MHKESTREWAVTLRKKGYAYPYISKKTGLSKSTLSGWLTEIPYTPNRETVEAFGKARAAAGEKRAKMRQEDLYTIRKETERDIGKVSKRDLFMFGLGLYLGEGAKTHSVVRIVNGDPRVIQAAISWFTLLGVTQSQLAPRLHLYPDSDIRKSLLFWSKTISIPISQFQKSYIDQRVDKKKKKLGKMPHGTMHLGIRAGGRKEFGVLFSRKILLLNENVLKKLRD